MYEQLHQQSTNSAGSRISPRLNSATSISPNVNLHPKFCASSYYLNSRKLRQCIIEDVMYITKGGENTDNNRTFKSWFYILKSNHYWTKLIFGCDCLQWRKISPDKCYCYKKRQARVIYWWWNGHQGFGLSCCWHRGCGYFTLIWQM